MSELFEFDRELAEILITEHEELGKHIIIENPERYTSLSSFVDEIKWRDTWMRQIGENLKKCYENTCCTK